ncbi:hypothetical protein [Segniliparus rugosus]|uniref:Beta-ketoacyl-[acyl-carrier-protein] synthase III N-terminal domain-containing protein n=1 Tax=Segniliparus rugosus (strain ATCC BAA-974 / DSM 45345 / CCUG 50838 / CIP 108380 / JCM 13579 / CDC 945) TaxID=679197 RepID=E5XQL7_SEGRC|nr:hypothetical protein [Segniliparus rugosus]EFV13330.2 hypothetical protein HMPREF9336_01789 [Segniliparus rugosus ATCC BAA-974]
MGVVIRSSAANADPDTLSSLERGSRAVAAAIAAAGLAPEAVGALINTGVYRDSNMVEPAMAALIQKKAGIGLEYATGAVPAFSFDLMNGAVGALNAVQVAQALLATGSARHVVIVSGDAHPSLDPAAQDGFPFATVGAALLLQQTPGPAGFGALQTASDNGAAPPEGYLKPYEAGAGGRAVITVDRPADLAARLAPLAVRAARAVIAADGLDLDRTLVVSSRPTAEFAGSLAEALGVPAAAVVTARAEADPHTSAVPLAYHQAREAGLLDGARHLLFVAAGGGPTAAAIGYLLPEGEG